MKIPTAAIRPSVENFQINRHGRILWLGRKKPMKVLTAAIRPSQIKGLMMIRGTVFILCTLLLVRFSWRALRDVKAHGFYRFFAFEGIVALLLVNQPVWFENPFSPLHLLSWLLLGLSICFIVQSLKKLKKEGGHGHRGDMPGNHDFENTVNIVETGIYRFVRHPMYASLLFLGWGAFLKRITLLNICLISVVTLFLLATARVEENENVRFFGISYEDYMRRTRMFIPWVL
ncbi:methyltransferase family protein [Desulfomarina sp.]